MDQGITNGIFVLLVVLFFVGRFVWSRFLRPQEDILGKGLEEVEALYKKKTRYRLGVLAFSLCALGAMYLCDSRAIPFFFVVMAALCQIGAMRQNTRKAFAKNMEDKMRADF